MRPEGGLLDPVKAALRKEDGAVLPDLNQRCPFNRHNGEQDQQNAGNAAMGDHACVLVEAF